MRVHSQLLKGKQQRDLMMLYKTKKFSFNISILPAHWGEGEQSTLVSDLRRRKNWGWGDGAEVKGT